MLVFIDLRHTLQSACYPWQKGISHSTNAWRAQSAPNATFSLSLSLFTMKLEHRGRLSSWLHDRCRGSAPSRLLNHLNPNQKTSFGGAGLQANNSFSAWLACLRMLLVLTTFSVLCLCPLSNFRRLSYLSSTVRNVQWSQRPTVWFAG